MLTNPSLERLTEMRVSHVWFSDHSICYLELGALIPGRPRQNGTLGNPRGEITVFMGYDWLARNEGIEISRKDIHPKQNELNALTTKIMGASIVGASLVNDGQDLELSLSTGYTIISNSSEDEGPDWAISFN